MPFDPTLPQENTALDAAQMRAQLQSLKEEIDDRVTGPYVDGAVTAQAAANCNDVDNLLLTVSNPPTQAQVQSIVDKLAELMDVLKRV